MSYTPFNAGVLAVRSAPAAATLLRRVYEHACVQIVQVLAHVDRFAVANSFLRWHHWQPPRSASWAPGMGGESTADAAAQRRRTMSPTASAGGGLRPSLWSWDAGVRSCAGRMVMLWRH